MGVFPENPCEFAVEFVRKMRRHPDIIQIPSSRQVLSIPRLILSRYYRKGNLKPDDFIEISVVTSFPDNQPLAKKIAFEILFPNYKKRNLTGLFQGTENRSMEDFLSEDQKSELDQLQDLIDELELSKSVEQDKIKEIEQFMEELDSHRDKEPFKSALEFFNDDSELYQKQISSLEELLNETKKRLEEKINSLTPDELKAGNNLGLEDLIQEKSLRDWEKITSKALDNQDITKEIQNLLDSKNLEEILQTMKYLKQSSDNPQINSHLEHMKDHLQKQINNLDQLFNAAKNLGEVPEFDQNKVLENSVKNSSFEHNFNLANSLDQHFGTNLRSSLLDKYDQEGNNQQSSPNLENLTRSPLANKSWNSLFNKAIKRALNNAYNQRKPTEGLKELTNQLQQLMNDCANMHCSQKMAQKLPELMNKAIDTTKSPNQLKDVVEFLRKIGLNPEPNPIEKKGKELNMSDEDIFELIEPNYQLLKKLVEKNVRDFQRISNLMNQIKDQLNFNRMKELMSKALKNENQEAMGALGHFDLGNAMKSAQQTGGKEAMEKLTASLTAGSGENMLKQWFLNRKNIPGSIKQKVKELAKKMLVDLGIYYARARLGSSISGPIPINIVRPYAIGDDFDNIDLDETINNILEKGKKLSHIDYDDFYVHETAKGMRSLCVELDISGSMTGDKLTYMAISVAMLIYGMRKDELAITFFESNTHVLKRFNEEVDLEEIADELLDIEAKGGTQIQSALHWAREEFDQNSSSREKLNILFTDAAIFDLQDAVEDLRIIRSMGVDFILVCPEEQFNKKDAEKITKITSGQLLTLEKEKWEDFPKLISEIIKSKF